MSPKLYNTPLHEIFLGNGCAAALIFKFFGPVLIRLIYGVKFHDASRPLAWLALALPFMFINHFSLIELNGAVDLIMIPNFLARRKVAP